MVMRSRVSAFARPSVRETDAEAELSIRQGEDESQAEEVLEAITEDVGSDTKGGITAFGRGGVREPAAEKTTVIEPEPEVEVQRAEPNVAEAQERKRRGPKPGSTRKVKAVEKVAEDVIPVDQMAAPQVRTLLKDLEAEIKDARTRHESEMHGLRSKYRALHDRLFDLTK